MKRFVIAATVWAFGLAGVSFAAIFKDTFDTESVKETSPNGYSVYGDETLDKGVTKKASVSGEQSAYVAVDFNQEKWGVILIHDAGQWDLTGAILSAQIDSASDLSEKQGIVGFKLIDADGTECRTPDDKLFSPSMKWQRFSQPVTDITFEEAPGRQPGLDLAHIAQYGVIFFDRGDHNGAGTFFVDDVEATTASEDASANPPAGSEK